MKKLTSIFTTALLALSLGACSQIDTGNFGVESSLGQYKDATLSPGVYQVFTKKIVEVSGKEIPIDLTDMAAKTSDNVTLYDYDATVFYIVNPDVGSKLLTKFRTDLTTEFNDGSVGVGYNYVSRQAREVAYDAPSKFKMEDIHTKRAEIGDLIRTNLQKTLNAEVGEGWITITSVQVRALSPDPELEQAARQAAEIAFKTRQKQQEKELAIAEADRALEEAKGIANANREIARSLTPELLEMRRLEMMRVFAEQKNGSTVVLDAKATPLVSIK